MKITNRTLTIVLALIVVLSAAFAQQAKPGAKKETECPHIAAARASLDQLDKTLAEGRQSNDPAQMKASLEKAQAELADARKEMNQCPMMGGGGMHHHEDMDHMMSPENGNKQ